MNKSFSFTRWLNSPNAVSFTLAIGVIFLVTNYRGIIHRADPDNLQVFVYPFWIQVLLSHIDSLFFGLATAIIIFQSVKVWHKVAYCSFEGIMIFLNLNRNFIDSSGFNSQFLLATYIAVFSAFTLFFLGNLARQHNLTPKSSTLNGFQNKSAELRMEKEKVSVGSNGQGAKTDLRQDDTLEAVVTTSLDKPRAKRGKTINYRKVDNLLAKGVSPSDVARVMKCSSESIYRHIRDDKNDKID